MRRDARGSSGSELFRLLEPNSARSQQMAATIIGVLRQNVEIGPADAQGDRSVSVRLAPVRHPSAYQPGGLLTMPFTHALELGEGTMLASAMLPGLSLGSLHAARSAFFESGPSYPNTELFSWLSALAAAGHLEAYDVWLFGPAFPEEAQAWKTAHADRMTALQRYIDAHPFRPTTFIAPNAPMSMPAPASGDGG